MTASPPIPDLPAGVIAVGWATVELDRAADALALLLDPGAFFSDAPSSAALGARCRVARAAASGDLRIVVLEPETEGRLAAWLARFAEGWAATWSQTTGTGGDHRHAAWQPGPFGHEHLVPGTPLGVPYRLLVADATIES